MKKSTGSTLSFNNEKEPQGNIIFLLFSALYLNA
jgi:hypothetical protein